jgi:hypothetical protein
MGLTLTLTASCNLSYVDQAPKKLAFYRNQLHSMALYLLELLHQMIRDMVLSKSFKIAVEI